MKRAYWFSCTKFTVLVVVDQKNIVVDTAPIARKFVGQHRDNLKRWAESKFGPVATRRIG